MESTGAVVASAAAAAVLCFLTIDKVADAFCRFQIAKAALEEAVDLANMVEKKVVFCFWCTGCVFLFFVDHHNYDFVDDETAENYNNDDDDDDDAINLFRSFFSTHLCHVEKSYGKMDIVIRDRCQWESDFRACAHSSRFLLALSNH